LVCCTGGEEGDLQNPSLRQPGAPFHGLTPDEEKAKLAELRPLELAESARLIGFDDVSMLGYRDSGMADSPTNEHPEAFHQADIDEAAGRLVAEIRRTRPQVILTYGDDQRGYPHPDHLRVHDISVVAFDAAGDPDAFAGAGEPWQPLKLYYSVWSKARMLAMHAKFEELGLESPFSQEWLDRPSQDERITTRIDITDFADVRPKALLAHRTQIDPDSPFWFGIPLEEQRRVHPFDEYVLARSLVDTDQPEDDVFAGLHAAARSA